MENSFMWRKISLNSGTYTLLARKTQFAHVMKIDYRIQTRIANLIWKEYVRISVPTINQSQPYAQRGPIV